VGLSAARRAAVTAFLLELGAESRVHTGRTFLAHALAVGDLLSGWRCREAVCLAGVCHSIYGTETSTAAALPLDRRDALGAVIGAEAERLAYLNCAVDRRSLDLSLLAGGPPFRLRDRMARSLCELPAQPFDDLLHVHLADWLEQVPHSRIRGYRYDALRTIARRLGGAPLAAFLEV
jgi:hypothetical protein